MKTNIIGKPCAFDKSPGNLRVFYASLFFFSEWATNKLFIVAVCRNGRKKRPDLNYCCFTVKSDDRKKWEVFYVSEQYKILQYYNILQFTIKLQLYKQIQKVQSVSAHKQQRLIAVGGATRSPWLANQLITLTNKLQGKYNNLKPLKITSNYQYNQNTSYSNIRLKG